MSDKEILDLIVSFTRQLNELDKKYHPLLQDKDQDSSAVFTAHRADALKIYSQYLTQRERTCYTGISSPPKFSGVEKMERGTVEWGKNRAVATIYTKDSLDFQFTLICKNGQWLINSYKQRYHTADRTVEYKWQCGSF